MEISQIINTSIIPVILLPVTGLVSLVFYNRLATVNQRIRLLQKELRTLLAETASSKMQEMTSVLQKEIGKVHFRSKLISFSLICCLTSILFFSLCALFVALAVFVPGSIQIAFFFWLLGPILICLGTISGLAELILGASTIQLQTLLLEKWANEEESSGP